MTEFSAWVGRHPAAAAELFAVLAPDAPTPPTGKSEQYAQQQVTFAAAQQGARAWRNNVGATPAKIHTNCPRCSNPFFIDQQPVRYGLANVSSAMNEKFKSSDLILAIPRRITPEMVGTTIAQFGSVEVKRPGWQFTGNGREAAQAAWLALVSGMGGYACFSTGELRL